MTSPEDLRGLKESKKEFNAMEGRKRKENQLQLLFCCLYFEYAKGNRL